MLHGRDAYKKTKVSAAEAEKRRDEGARQIIDGSIEPKIAAAIELGRFEVEVTVDNALSASVRKLLNEDGYRVCDKPAHFGVGGYQPTAPYATLIISWSHYNGHL